MMGIEVRLDAITEKIVTVARMEGTRIEGTPMNRGVQLRRTGK